MRVMISAMARKLRYASKSHSCLSISSKAPVSGFVLISFSPGSFPRTHFTLGVFAVVASALFSNSSLRSLSWSFSFCSSSICSLRSSISVVIACILSRLVVGGFALYLSADFVGFTLAVALAISFLTFFLGPAMRRSSLGVEECVYRILLRRWRRRVLLRPERWDNHRRRCWSLLSTFCHLSDDPSSVQLESDDAEVHPCPRLFIHYRYVI